MSDSTILVLGATGSTGRRVTGRLRTAGFGVRAASRSGEIRFDWTDRSTWEPALAGAERMYLMAPHELPIDPALVTLAVEAGVRHIVLLSSRGIEAMGDERLLGADEDYLAAQTAFGAPEEQTRAEIAAFTAVREQGDATPTGTVEWVTGNPPKPFERYASEAAGRGAWR
jgi:hypothetical protein